MPTADSALDIALDAVSEDLDAIGDEVATMAGQVAQTNGEVHGMHKKLDDLIELITSRVLPAIDSVDDIRRRVVYLEDYYNTRPRQRHSDAE
jgi:hypothetical protein